MQIATLDVSLAFCQQSIQLTRGEVTCPLLLLKRCKAGLNHFLGGSVLSEFQPLLNELLHMQAK